MISKALSPIRALLATALLATSGLAVAADGAAHDNPTLIAAAKHAGNFTILVQAIEAAGLTETLGGEGPFTVFAPTDEAFGKLPAADLAALMLPENKDKLVRVLSLHVIPGKAMDQYSLKRVRSVDTVAGETIHPALVRGRLRVNDARITADVDASNGVIHAIDRVLIPN
ncbi:MAG TPA: fasciclin domain-containing protein [Steroidobacteraceae bacterium]|nr:fasciclin domain-containing protein [Steroidobacteraceae bacterium]